jgi:hypothetical protein
MEHRIIIPKEQVPTMKWRKRTGDPDDWSILDDQTITVRPDSLLFRPHPEHSLSDLAESPFVRSPITIGTPGGLGRSFIGIVTTTPFSKSLQDKDRPYFPIGFNHKLIPPNDLLENVSHSAIPTGSRWGIAGRSRFGEWRLFPVELHGQDDIEQIVPRPDEEVRIPEEVDYDRLLIQLFIVFLFNRIFVSAIDVESHNIGLLWGVIPEDVQMFLEIRYKWMLNTNSSDSDIRPLLSLEWSV